MVLILAVFLIPIATSSLRGLSHVLTCEQEVSAPFTVVVSEDGSAIVVSSATGTDTAGTLCGGLRVDMKAGTVHDGRLDFEVLVGNESDFPWQGTIDLSLDETGIPVSVGRVEPGEVATETVSIRLRPGTYELDGTLLVGP